MNPYLKSMIPQLIIIGIVHVIALVLIPWYFIIGADALCGIVVLITLKKFELLGYTKKEKQMMCK